MLGGAFFPFEVMPKWMAAVGRLTPNGWALERFKDLLFGEIGMAQLALNTLGLTAVTLLILWLARRRIEGAFLRA
jgi:ABC-type uncharacterized transport system permease subunit